MIGTDRKIPDFPPKETSHSDTARLNLYYCCALRRKSRVGASHCRRAFAAARLIFFLLVLLPARFAEPASRRASPHHRNRLMRRFWPAPRQSCRRSLAHVIKRRRLAAPILHDERLPSPRSRPRGPIQFQTISTCPHKIHAQSKST